MEAVARRLIGRRPSKILYYGLRSEEDPRGYDDWDYGDWHHPVMGVELYVDNERYSCVWGGSFGEYGLELFDSPMTDHLVRVEESDGTPFWDVTEHPMWQALLTDPIVGTKLLWARSDTGTADPMQVPTAVRLDFARGTAWVVAAMPQGPEMDRFWVPADEVLVAFSAEFIRRLDLPS